MLQAIRTYALGPTNSRGARVKATSCGGASVTLAWDYALGIEGNHNAAAKALAEKLEWDGRWYGGALDERGYCYIRSPISGAPAVADFAVWPKAEG